MKKNLCPLVCALLLSGFSFVALAQAPAFTGGHVQGFAVCMNSTANSIDTLMAVADTSTGHSVSWSIVSPPAHATLVATFTATSAAGTLTPAGLSYTPNTGYSGRDTFAVRFTDGATADTTTVDVIVDTLFSPGVLTGPSSVCVGASITLTDTVPGGSWAVVNAAASVAGGVVSGLTPGTDTASYTFTNGCGIAGATAIVHVTPLPNAGTLPAHDSVCVGGNITLTPGGDVGGIWHSTNTVSATVDADGIVTGMAPGSARIAYLVTNACGADTAITEVKVQIPVQPIIGGDTVCQIQTLTLLDLTTGGAWSSSAFLTAPVIGTMGAGLVIGGIVPGEAVISYTLHNACGTTTATLNVTVLSMADCAAGISTTSTVNDELTVFPNPGNGIFTMNLSSGIDEAANVVVTNIVGEKVMSVSAETNKPKEFWLGAPAGMYFMTVSTKHGSYTAKLVVQH